MADRLVVAIDFGTTFSGVASAYSQNPKQIHVVTQWPNSRMTTVKVPTLFTYEVEDENTTASQLTSNTLLDSLKSTTAAENKVRKEIRWGGEIADPQEPRISCIKLFLDRDQKLPEFVDVKTIFKQLVKARRTPVAAAADFLHKVITFVLDDLNARYTEDFMKSTPIEYVMTVPAIWSDAAKDATKKAAQLAGITGPLKMISEPEAAAIWTLEAIKLNGLSLVPGDNIVVCDAGGGTVDLISYRLIGLEPFEIRESTVGTGDVCGGAILNCRFESMMRTRFGEESFAKFQEDMPHVWQDALQRFEEYVKPQFGASTMQTYTIPFPGMPDNPEAGIRGGYLKLKSDEVKALFDPVIDQIIKLVEDQVTAVRDNYEKVAAIACVGGFGQSKYLFSRLRSHFQSELPPAYTPTKPKARASAVHDADRASIKVLQPPEGVTACMRGAIVSGLRNTIVTERKSRYHYGVKMSSIFKPGKHLEANKYWDKYDEKFRARDVMQWYVAKGEAVSDKRTVSFPFVLHMDADEIGRPDFTHSNALMACRENQAPVNKDEDVFKVCTMESNLSTVPRSEYRKRSSPSGMTYYELSYDLIMIIDSASIDFKLKMGDKIYGSVNASFEQ